MSWRIVRLPIPFRAANAAPSCRGDVDFPSPLIDDDAIHIRGMAKRVLLLHDVAKHRFRLASEWIVDWPQAHRIIRTIYPPIGARPA